MSPARRRTPDECSYARQLFVTSQSTVMREYNDGLSVLGLVAKWQVSRDFVRARLDDWGVERRDPATAAAVRASHTNRLKLAAEDAMQVGPEPSDPVGA